MDYLVTNPHAMDTLEGIGRWWLSGVDAGESGELAAAVRWMVRAKWLSQARRCGEIFYGVTEFGLQEGSQYLERLRKERLFQQG